MKKIKNICTFCGASKGSSVFVEAAKKLADAILAAGMTLVYGGAKVGLMGVLADRIVEGGGRIVGVMPRLLIEKEIAYTQLTELHIVDSMSERKNLMAEISDAFIMLPGGIGSLDEFFEIITLAQLGLHSKPRGILNTANYYEKLLAFLDHAVDESFWNIDNRNQLIIDTDPNRLLSALGNYQAPLLDRWAGKMGLVNQK